MKIVKVKGFGKFNKAVEDELNKVMAETENQTWREFDEWSKQYMAAEADELAFAE